MMECFEHAGSVDEVFVIVVSGSEKGNLNVGGIRIGHGVSIELRCEHVRLARVRCEAVLGVVCKRHNLVVMPSEVSREHASPMVKLRAKLIHRSRVALAGGPAEGSKPGERKGRAGPK